MPSIPFVCVANINACDGQQLKAARRCWAWSKTDLAARADLHVNTIRKMEAKGAAEITSGADIVRRVQSALEAAGVEFLNHGRPGVRLRAEGLAPSHGRSRELLRGGSAGLGFGVWPRQHERGRGLPRPSAGHAGRHAHHRMVGEGHRDAIRASLGIWPKRDQAPRRGRADPSDKRRNEAALLSRRTARHSGPEPVRITAAEAELVRIIERAGRSTFVPKTAKMDSDWPVTTPYDLACGLVRKGHLSDDGRQFFASRWPPSRCPRIRIGFGFPPPS